MWSCVSSVQSNHKRLGRKVVVMIICLYTLFVYRRSSEGYDTVKVGEDCHRKALFGLARIDTLSANCPL